MQTQTFESSESSEIDTWNQPRSAEQLLGFIASREAEIFGTESEA
jgi:hypothetical protein